MLFHTQARHIADPSRIDEEKATAAREEMIRKKVIYGHSVPYRNMCRFNSGVSSLLLVTSPRRSDNSQYFFRHPLLANYDYYWRIEPSIKLFCDISACTRRILYEVITDLQHMIRSSSCKTRRKSTVSPYRYLNTSRQSPLYGTPSRVSLCFAYVGKWNS